MQNNNEIYELYIEAKKQVKRRCKDDENCINIPPKKSRQF